MSPKPPKKEEDALLVRQCLEGESEALTTLRRSYNGDLVNILLSRGATPTESDDLLADLWDDCVVGSEDRPSLLEKFSGRCALRNWLATVATRRWIDLRRRRGRHVESSAASAEGPAPDLLDNLPGLESKSSDEALANLLLESLRQAFRDC